MKTLLFWLVGLGMGLELFVHVCAIATGDKVRAEQAYARLAASGVLLLLIDRFY